MRKGFLWRSRRFPKSQKNNIDRAGKILSQTNPSPYDYQWAINLAKKWRACHAYPINTFQANVRTKLKAYSNEPITAQRLKRMPTIIDKLKRYPDMKLTTMQDIGGVRAILHAPDDVFRLAGAFRDSRRLSHELLNNKHEKDYITSPRDEDGYRSLHLIYKYDNNRAKDYNGLRLELQIRTKLEHTWATAVETMGTFLGQALKSRQGDKKWIDFFAIVSSAFAWQERMPLVPRFSSLNIKETFQQVAEAERKLNALEQMKGLSVAAKSISPGKSWSFHLIILDSLNHTVKVVPYDRDSFERAVNDYSKYEEKAANGEKIEPVLVSAGSYNNLSKAYPNFFLDISDFIGKVEGIIKESKAP